ncbi:MAG: hypothetical protein MR608_05395, partial [Clostridiales bacterium]|nr:hypothetical protein [Clostridiales bacterium]
NRASTAPRCKSSIEIPPLGLYLVDLYSLHRLDQNVKGIQEELRTFDVAQRKAMLYNDIKIYGRVFDHG